MEENKKTVRLEDMLPVITEKIEQGGEVVIPVTGISMQPMLVSGRDYAVIEKAPEKLKKYDIPFYRREDGRFILHRVVGEDENGYILLGDNQNEKEYGIKHSQVIAVMTAVERNGKRIPVKNIRYAFNGVLRDEIYYYRRLKARLAVKLRKIKNGKKG